MSKETQRTLRICSDNSVLRCPLSLFYHDMLHLALQHDHPARLLLLQFCVHEMVKDTLVPGDVGGDKRVMHFCCASAVFIRFPPFGMAVEIRQSRLHNVRVNDRAIGCKGLR